LGDQRAVCPPQGGCRTHTLPIETFKTRRRLQEVLTGPLVE
jgi:hypothetical protein